ncbi:MAG: nickel pincer cofactor biosynthesis protein LarB [Opitutales bacterium]|nr:nickel pincer cofactor biosynthesis protein LarB [Opitutales bacterium]
METLESILADFKARKITEKAAAKKIAELGTIDLGHTKIDASRRARTGAGEVIYGAGKTAAQVLEIAKAIASRGGAVFATRLKKDALALLEKNFEGGRANEIARTFALGGEKKRGCKKFVAIVSAGTSDMPVCEEARETLEFFGERAECFYDCGVAGLHRLLEKIGRISEASVVIAVAGMEGALASVVAGLVKAPVIAVPTSVGYGASFGGIAALLAMMNSCANGVSVVNIDNGFGAAYCAHAICRAK